MAIHYAREQASKIVKKLGASALPLRERLVEAYVGAFLPALGDAEDQGYLPEDLDHTMRLLANRMTALEALGDEGTLHATLSRMTDHELEGCADDMIVIALRILRLGTRRPG
jgi:hypothetical protein